MPCSEERSALRGAPRPGTRQVQTIALQPGDRIMLWLDQVRTVESVTHAGYTNQRGVTIWTVHYAEGKTEEWSAGNTGASDTLWDVLT